MSPYQQIQPTDRHTQQTDATVHEENKQQHRQCLC